MFTPLPLRLCCLAAMAPALTEAASQAQNFKLPHSSPDLQNSPVLLNGRAYQPCEVSELQNCSDIPRASILNKATITSLQNKDLINIIKKDTIEIGTLEGTNTISNIKPLSHFGSLANLPGLLKKEILNAKSSNGSTIPFSINTNNSLTHHLTTMNKSSNFINGMDKNKSNVGLFKPSDNSNNGQTSWNSSFNNTNGQKSENYALLEVGNAKKAKSNEENSKNLNSTMAMCTEVSKRQAHLERKADRVIRRLRKLQVRHVQSHIHEQLLSFLEHQRKTLQSLSRNTKVSTPSSNCSVVEFKTELLQSEDVKNLSTAALVNLVRKLESTHGSALRQKLSSCSSKSDKSEGYNIKLNEDMCKEMNRAASTLESNLRHLEKAIDSDATESSSGGESCDELEGYDDTKTNHTPIHRRGTWKWAVERTGVASRWTWLQAQVSDLEYRIRQQSDIYRQIRATKGSVVLAEIQPSEDLQKQRLPHRTSKKLSPIEAKIANLEQQNEISPSSLSSLLSNVDNKQNVNLPSSVTCFAPVSNGKKQPTLQTSKLVNGFIDNNSNGSHGNHNKLDSSECDSDSCKKNSSVDIISGMQQPVVDSTCQAARVRSLKSFRKRKLFRPAGLHLVSRKAAKLSTLKCGCAPPFTPCAMCGGRYNNTQTLDPDIMSLEERVAHLDPSFHPVLSFPQDTPLPIHFKALLKSGEWQNKSPPKPVPNIKKKPKLFSPLSEHARKHSKKLARSAAATLLTSARLRKFGDKSLTKTLGSSIVSTPKHSLSESRIIKTELRKKRTATQMAIAAFSNRHRSLSISSNSSNTSPTPVSQENSSGSGSHSHLQTGPIITGHSTTFREMLRRRRGESAFDINNIVIPYSMAASTRVEKLQYKEIITPKWRPIEDAEKGDDDDDELTEISSQIEDLTDEAFVIRHQACEIEEKKRFMTYVQHNKRGAVRGSRTDSGANSPDMFSAQESYDHFSCGSVSSPLTPPPSASGKGEESHPTRRRSGSFCRQYRLSDDHRNTPEITEDVAYVYVPPFDLRTFPLSEEEYQHLLEPSNNTDNLKIEKRLGETCPLSESRPSSPISSTSGSIIDDPNDPEWTVVTAEKAKEGKPAIVLKISKR